MKKLVTIVVVMCLLPMLGCSPLENQARDGGGAFWIDRRCTNKIPGDVCRESDAGNLPDHQSRSVWRECFDYRGRDLLRVECDIGSS
jgi:hypothetical protein